MVGGKKMDLRICRKSIQLLQYFYFGKIADRQGRSGGFDHATRFDAVGADHQLLNPALMKGANILQIGLETAFGHIVGVAHVAAHHRLLSTNFTYSCHWITPLRSI